MMKKALLASALVTGLILPAEAGLYVPPKPAIIKPENIEFSKHLLAMPLTMGMLPKSTSATFPVIAATATTTSSTSATTHTINLPSGIQSGNILFMVLQYRNNTRTVSSFSQSWGSALMDNSGTSRRTYMFSRVADGTEGSTTTLTLSGSSDYCMAIVWRVTGAQSVQVGTAATGTSTAPNPPSLSPSWGSANTLWAAYVGVFDERQSFTYSTNYTLSQTTTTGQTSGGGAGSWQEGWLAGRQLAAASEDPAAGTLTGSIEWVAQTIAFRPS